MTVTSPVRQKVLQEALKVMILRGKKHAGVARARLTRQERREADSFIRGFADWSGWMLKKVRGNVSTFADRLYEACELIKAERLKFDGLDGKALRLDRESGVWTDWP